VGGRRLGLVDPSSLFLLDAFLGQVHRDRPSLDGLQLPQRVGAALGALDAVPVPRLLLRQPCQRGFSAADVVVLVVVVVVVLVVVVLVVGVDGPQSQSQSSQLVVPFDLRYRVSVYSPRRLGLAHGPGTVVLL